MDPITHGLTGALIGKAFFAEPDTPASHGARRVAVFAATIGAVFPDIDVILGPITHNDMATIELHRGFTHSLTGVPVFAVLLAALTHWYARRRGRETLSWGMLAVLYGLGIASHVLLDVITSFGTMVWSPWNHTRVQCDLTFIIDFTMTAIVLVPHVVQRIYRVREGSLVRATRAWVVFALLALGAEGVLRAAGFPIAPQGVVAAILVFAALFFLPRWGGWGFRVQRSTWARAGLMALVTYLGLCGAAHHVALERVEQFTASRGLRVEQLGALPLPPSAGNWSGLVRTPDGVYEARFDLLSRNPGSEPVFHFVADTAPESYIEAAKQLPRVQTYLWFARFPVFRGVERGNKQIVEISDLRFFTRGNRPPSFSYQVMFDAAGRVIQQGLARGVR